MTTKRLAGFLFGMLLVFAWCGVASAGGVQPTQGAAVAMCQQQIADWKVADPTTEGWVCVLRGDGTVAGQVGDTSGTCASHLQSGAWYTPSKGDYDFGDSETWCVSPDGCQAGRAAVPNKSWTDGTNCDDNCLDAWVITIGGGGPSGGYVQNGASCPYHDVTDPPKPPKVPDPPSCNADGSCQVCNGDSCVSTGNDTPGPPAPASGGSSGAPDGNHETNAHSDNSYAGGGGTGTGGGGDGTGGDGTGGGDTGTGTGSTGDGAPSSSDTKCKDGVCDVGEADGALGGLYQGSGETPSSVFSGFVSQVSNTPIASAVGGFFNVQAGGSCPSWHIPGNQFWGPAGFDFSFFCADGMLAIFGLAGWLVLAGAAFCAFRIAIY